MSRQNKVNRDRYMQAGRLTPDEMARERLRQRETLGKNKEQVTGKTRPAGRASTRPRTGREE
jgi:hypothetical protein